MPSESKESPEILKQQHEAHAEALKRIEECLQNKEQSLSLGDLGLVSLPPEIGQLTSLTFLNLSRNQLTELTPEIGRLTSLKSLNLSRNQLSALPEEISQSRTLMALDLFGNQFTSLPASLSNVTTLESLGLSKNKLTSVPPIVFRLAALKNLYLRENRLTTLPPEIARLTALTELRLSGNRLTSLPPELGQLLALTTLYVHDNPELGLPLEVLGPTLNEVTAKRAKPPAARAILDYYFSTRGSAGRALREVKLILVGRGEVGKSSMAEVLLGKKFIKKRKRTDGIAITPWQVALEDGPAKVLMWDFGGQEIMHGTHQFFLTHRSLYVVMVDGRHDRQKQDAEYWLKLVRAFGGDSPVLVVMNRQKENSFDMDRQHLADKYGVKLEHFFRTDCTDLASIIPLRTAILGEVARILAAEERFPAKCWAVKAWLEDMQRRGEDYLSDDAYADVCAKRGVEHDDEQRKLLRRLADLGTVVSFPDEVKLSELTVLNPAWATDGIYRVVTDDVLREQRHGQLKLSALRKLLPRDRWPKPRHVRYVLDLMEKFELCFSVGDKSDTVLVPDLLPDQTPPLTDWDATKCVVFLYQYTVLPHGVLPRFITRTHEFSGGRERWRSGVVLADDGAEALIKADYDRNCISIWVRGPYADARRGLLKVVRHHLDHIHSRISELNPEQRVGVPGHPTVTVPYCDLILDERDRKQTTRVTLDGKRVELAISDLLNGVETPAERRKAQTKISQREMARSIVVEGDYIEGHKPMTQDNSINIGGDNYGQVGLTLTNCSNMIQMQAPGERKTLLEELETLTKQLMAALPPEKKEEAAGNLELAVKGVVSNPPNRKWYSLSAEGLLDASKFVKNFSGNIAGTLGNLGKLLWADFKLPGK